MDLGLGNKSVLITGGSRGIGFASADLFLAEGCSVTIVGKDPGTVRDAVASLEAKHGGRIEGLAADLSESSGRERLSDRLSTVDILVNNAGAIPGGSPETVPDDVWRGAWELKVYGYLHAARIALPAMMARGSGVIVNVIGLAGVAPSYDYMCGGMANAALIAFTKAAGGRATSRGARVIGVNPGPTQTDRLVKLYRARAQERLGDPERWRELLTDLPFGRAALAEEMADLIVFLASRRASYLSGVVIDADGGRLFA